MVFCRLETKSRMKLERLEGILSNNIEGIDKEAHRARMERVKSQISDQSALWEAFNRRDAHLDAVVESRLSPQSTAQWRFVVYFLVWQRHLSKELCRRELAAGKQWKRVREEGRTIKDPSFSATNF